MTMQNLNGKMKVDIHNKENIVFWSAQLNCTEAELLYCISKVGSSINSIESYLQMNKSILQIWATNNSL